MDVMTASYRIDRNTGKAVVWIFARDKSCPEKRQIIKVTDFQPFFYRPATADEPGAIQDIWGRWVAVEHVGIPTETRAARDKYKDLYTCQADIPFAYNYLLVNKVVCGFRIEGGRIIPQEHDNIPPRILYLDIEVKSPKEKFPYATEAAYPIVTIQCWDSYTRKKTLFTWGVTVLDEDQQNYPDEMSMFLAWVDYMQVVDPDIITAWNGEMFDFAYLDKRAENIGITRIYYRISPMYYAHWFTEDMGHGFRKAEYKVKGREVIDFMRAYQKWHKAQGEPETLDYKVCTANETGFKYTDYGDQIDRLWNEDHATLVEYIRNEALSFQKWHDTVGIIQDLDSRRRITGGFTRAVMDNSRAVDSLALYLTDCPLPTKSGRAKGKTPDIEELEQNKFQGATVIQPPLGLHENVVAFDLKALYPTLIMYIMPTIFKDKRAKLLAKIARVLVDGREKFRTARKKAYAAGQDIRLLEGYEVNYKFLACSEYGVTGYPGFRLFDKHYAETITGLGRELIIYMRDELKKIGYVIVYGDTDSVWVKMKTKNIVEAKQIERYINDRLFVKSRFYFAAHPPEVKMEKFCASIFFAPKRGKTQIAAKKRYVAHVIWDEGKVVDKMLIKGFETRRSDSPKVLKKIMAKFLEGVVRKKDVKGAISYLREEWEGFDKYQPIDVAIPKGVDHRKAYKTTNRWLTGCGYMTEEFGWQFREDQKPRLLYVKKVHGHPPTESLCIVEGKDLPKEVDIDWEKMREKILQKKFLDIVEYIGGSWNDIKREKTKQMKLEGFA